MKKEIAYWGITVIFFVIYYKLLGFIWDKIVPWNSYTDILALFVLIFINIPLSVFSTEKLIDIIKSDNI